MRLWRISNFIDLHGDGGEISSGRWHSQGPKIVYLAESPAGALLERLVHLEFDVSEIPVGYQLIAVDVAGNVGSEAVAIENLPQSWRDDDVGTRAAGDRWLAGSRTALLQVPSAIVPFTWNWLLNPSHPEAQSVKIADVVQARFDRRLFR
jgi:RES domain-containing protein